MSKEIEFSEIMCARFCHDIAGCIGAINNSIDFLDSNNAEMREKAVDLIQFSSVQAISRVSFFRKAYGFLSTAVEMNLSEIRELVTAFLGAEKLDLEFSRDWNNDPIEVNLGKLILNAALIVATVVMHRGKIMLEFDKESQRVEILSDSTSSKIDENLALILEGKGESIEKNTRNIQHFYTYAVAKSAKYDIDLSIVSGRVKMVLSKT